MTNTFRHQKTGVYYFRKAIPEPLRAAMGKTEVKVSLGTKDPLEAKRRAHVKALEVDALLQELAKGNSVEHRDMLSDAEIAELAELWKYQGLESDETLRREGAGEADLYERLRAQVEQFGGTASFTADEVSAKYGMSDREFQREAHTLATVTSLAKNALAKGDIGYFGNDGEVDDFLSVQGIQLEKESPTYRKVAYALLRAEVELLDLLNKRQVGESIPTPSPPTPVWRNDQLAKAAAKDSLQSVFDRWKAERKPPTKTALEFGAAVRRFEELHGAIPVQTITKAMVVAFKDALLQLLARPNHDLRKLPLPEQIVAASKIQNKPKLSAASVRKQLNAVKAVLGWAAENALIEHNPGTKVGVRDPEANRIKRFSYDLSDLKVISNFSIFAEGLRPLGGKGEAAYWLPILSMYTGARLEELGQLLIADIREEDGIHHIRFRSGEREGVKQKLKNASSHRRVPLHPEIIRLGILRYRDSRSESGDPRLFPELSARKSTGQLTASWSSWWGRYARENGVPEMDKSFHSFRHSFKDACRRAGIEEAIHDALTGHTGGGTGRKYGSGDTPMIVLAAQINKITYPGVEWKTSAS